MLNTDVAIGYKSIHTRCGKCAKCQKNLFFMYNFSLKELKI